MRVCAFTSICEEDACWIPQYLKEVDRLCIDIAVHFDRCSSRTKLLVKSSPYFVGGTYQNDVSVEFNEMHKQAVFNFVQTQGYQWAMAWDIDETYEADAPMKLKAIGREWDVETDFVYSSDCLDTRWLTLWGDSEHIRVDLNFAEGHRVKFYNLNSGEWKFDHPITNGAKLMKPQGKPSRLVPVEAKVGKFDFVCLHWGMMTHPLRMQHKQRWDRIYSTALRGDKNPYQFWQQAVDPRILPITVKHGYFREDD